LRVARLDAEGSAPSISRGDEAAASPKLLPPPLTRPSGGERGMIHQRTSAQIKSGTKYGGEVRITVCGYSLLKVIGILRVQRHTGMRLRRCVERARSGLRSASDIPATATCLSTKWPEDIVMIATKVDKHPELNHSELGES
jgi:hypothetical protein